MRQADHVLGRAIIRPKEIPRASTGVTASFSGARFLLEAGEHGTLGFTPDGKDLFSRSGRDEIYADELG